MEYPFKDLLPLDEVLAREGYYKDWTHLDPEVFYSLTQISEYIKTKGYGVDVRLLIAQLAEHFSLKTSQINEIERLFNDVMKELSEDKDFYSLPEIAGARRGYSTLAESLDNLSVNMINKNLGKLDQSFMTDEFLQQMVGNTPINAVPADGSITTSKLANNSVTTSKIANNSININKLHLYNSLSNLNWETGQFDGNGAPVTDVITARLRCMGFMKLNQGDKIIAYDGYRFNLFFYSDADQSTFTSELNAWVTSYTVTNDTYVRIQISHKDGLDLSDKIDEIDSMIRTNQGVVDGDSLKNGTINMSKLSGDLQNVIGKNNKEVDLFIFMGQSNMAGRGTASQAPSVPSGHGYEFKSISNPARLHDIVEPFGVAENNATSGVTEGNKTGSMVSALANVYYNLTKTPIVGVSCSKGGTSVNFWQPGSAPLLDAITRFETAENWLITNGYTIRNKSMVWCQGESDGDSSMSGSEYKDKFNAMVTEMFNSGIENCYLVRIGNHRDNPSLYNEIINSQTEIAKEENNVILVSTKFDKMASDGLMKDLFHYTQTGYNIVGEEAGTNIAYHVNNKKEPVIYDWENKELYYSYK